MDALSSKSRFCKPSIEYRPEIATSTMYSIIPSAFRSRLPVLRSFRRSAESSPKSETLRPGLQQNLGKEVSRYRESFSSCSTVVPSEANTPFRPCTPESGEMNSLEMSPLEFPIRQGSQSDIDWDVATAGIRLWICAKSQMEKSGNAVLCRSMYIDSLRYMHMALPNDLNVTELEALQSSILARDWNINKESLKPRISEPSLARRMVAQTVCRFVATVLILLPILVRFLNGLLQYERQNHITERFVSNALSFVEDLCERSSLVLDATVRFRQGRLGSACHGATVWLVDGFVGGINDGIHQSMQRTR